MSVSSKQWNLLNDPGGRDDFGSDKKSRCVLVQAISGVIGKTVSDLSQVWNSGSRKSNWSFPF